MASQLRQRVDFFPLQISLFDFFKEKILKIVPRSGPRERRKREKERPSKKEARLASLEIYFKSRMNHFCIQRFF